MVPLPPWEVVRRLEKLRDGLPPERRDIPDPLLAWVQLACTRRRQAVTAAKKGRMMVDWKLVNPDRKLMRWAKRTFSGTVQQNAPGEVGLNDQKFFNKACKVVKAMRADGSSVGSKKD
mmetsp:Transcript_6387/g.18723  ORF Transcript_6387/g.18723 Transcript_6387/m.18723 type:complete len:118 (+) Transcript_6387:977-1330(+)